MRILIVDDHQLFMDGLTMLIRGLAEHIEVIQAVSVGDAREKLEKNIDLVIMDLRMPGMKGVRTIEGLINRLPQSPFVIVSATESQADVDACMDAGAMGFIPKSAPSVEMINILRKVMSGVKHHPQLRLLQSTGPGTNKNIEKDRPALFTRLSERQLQVLTVMAQGKTNKEIAQDLNISEHTVKTHVAHLFSVFRVGRRLECAQQARIMGLL